MNNMSKFGSAWSHSSPPRRSNYSWLGKRLRQLLNVYEEEPVPDRFRELLDQLEKSEATRGQQAGANENSTATQKPQS